MCPRLRRRARRALVALLAHALLLGGVELTGAAPAGAEPPGGHAPPVDGSVLDPFREPAGPYGPGNRGLDYATEPGTAVLASAAGEVTFAGLVGGTRHVVVLHADGLRTSYSFLAEVSVRRGDVVQRGAVLGRSGSSLHFGARAGERYVDPALLFEGAEVDVRLVPVEERRARPVGEERRGLVEQLLRAGALGAPTTTWLWLAGEGAGAARATVAAGSDVLGAAVDAGRAGLPLLATALGAATARQHVLVVRAARAVLTPVLLSTAAATGHRAYGELRDDQQGCTPSTVPPPPPAPGRRIVVLVAGYGSSGGHADVLDVDTEALGYAPADRVQLSYAGGRVAGVGALAGVPTSTYGPADSMVDLRTSGAHLRRLLHDIAAAHPEVPVDVVAHSQGGLVVREALGATSGEGSPPEAGPLTVDHVVTLASPHHGAPAATLAGTFGLTSGSSVLGGAVASSTGGDIDPSAPSVAQMAAGSSYLDGLARRPLSTALAFTSIGAAGDLVVPGLSSVADGATNALVGLGGPAAHGELPGSPEAAREMALALGGRGPTCVPTTALASRVATATVVATGELAVGGTAAPTAVLVDGVARLLLASTGQA